MKNENNNVLKMIYKNAKNRGDGIALRFRERSISYRELVRKMNVVSKKIINSEYGNEKKQIPVVVIGERGIEFVISLLGVMQSGNYYIPIEMPFPEKRLENIVQQMEKCLIITTQKYAFLDQYKGSVIVAVEECEENEDETIYGNELRDEDICYMMFTSGTQGKPKGVLIRYDSLCNLVSSKRPFQVLCKLKKLT